MQSLSSGVDFSQVLNQKASKTALDLVLKNINPYGAGEGNKQQAKRKAHEFLTKIHNYLKEQSSTESSKFYTLLILKFVTEKEERTILSVLTTHPLYKYLASLARQTDPYLPVDEKGKNLFKDKKIGREFIRFILQSIKVWGEKFASNKKNQESHFKRTYDDLVQKGVIMPSQMVFYNKSILSNRKSVSEIKSKQDPTNTPSSSTKKQQGVRIGNDTESEMKTMQEDIDRIDKFVRLLEGNGNQENYCHDYHKVFLKQAEKYQSLINKLISSNDEEGLHIALAINEFYTQQNAAYREFFVEKKDLFSYVNLIQIKVDELHQNLSKTPQKKQTKQYMKKQVKVMRVNSRKNNLVQGDNIENKQLVSQLMTKLNQKSTSRTKGFKEIKDSLSKEKSSTRLKRSISGMRKSGVSKFGKSITKSRIAGIFSNPPNPYPQAKRYQGQMIQTSHQMQIIMGNLTKNQGIRRFVTSNFKNKNPLFQNTHIQIGFKSQPIYEQVPDYNVILSIELFIGNKTQNQINNLSLEYIADSTTTLLYATPKTINTYLQSGYQIKHQLLVIPLINYFSFVHLTLNYNYRGEQFNQKIILPNSIIKFIDSSKISKREFVQSWNASTIFRTKQFKLTRYIAPDCLVKYINGLSQLSSYDQFVTNDSETDYQLGCQVILMKKYQAVLRISVRPNLNAVLQIGITDQSKDAHQGFVNCLQTLQMLLTHVDHQT